MLRTAIAAAVLSMALLPAAFASETAASPGDIGLHAKAHRVIHYRSSSAAPLAADERSLADAREHRQTRAMNLIGAAGYGDFTDLTADGKNFRATAMKGGQRIAVVVDPDDGRVTPAQ
jgi:hypothetical protein